MLFRSVVTSEFPATAAVAVGNSCGGGIVAYILQIGDPGSNTSVQHGLIAATADASSIMFWSNIDETEIGAAAQETAIGTGQANTTLIVNQVVGTTHCTSGAAYYCDNLTEGGYDDWFLPSKVELEKLYINKNKIGGFADENYWSSSEGFATVATVVGFYTDNSYGYVSKNSTFQVRAVREF